MRHTGVVAVSVLLALTTIPPAVAQCRLPSPTTLILPQSPPAGAAVVAADFDGDGDDDVIVYDAVPVPPKEWLIRHASRSPAVVPIANGLGYPVAALDIDGDGRAEVAVIRGSAVVFIRLAADGSWTELRRVEFQQTPTGRPVFGHFTGGQTLQMAMVVIDLPTMLLHVEVRDPLTSALLMSLPLANDSADFELAAGDLNGDGADDLVVNAAGHGTGFPHDFYTRLDGYITTYLSTHTSLAAADVCRTHDGLSSPAIGDFDGDGTLDVAVQRSSGDLLLFHGNGHGTLGTPQSLPWNFNAMVPPPLLADDLDRDGRSDVVTAGLTSVLIGFGAPDGWRVAEYATVGSGATVVLARSRGERAPSIVVSSDAGTAVLHPSCGRVRAIEH